MTPALDSTLTGGLSAVALFVDDGAGREAIVVRRAAPTSYAEEAESRVLQDGTLDDRRRTHRLPVAIAGWPDLAQLRRWRADGRRVRAVGVAQGRGPHVLWDEPVPVVLRPFNGGRGALAGDRLELHSAKFGAAVLQWPDLLGDDEAWAGAATRTLPVPDLTVYAARADGGEATVEALDAAGAVLASAGPAPNDSSGPTPATRLRLPAGTWSVRVTSSVRPVLVTRLGAASGPTAPIETEYQVVEERESAYTVRGTGGAGATREPDKTVTYKDGRRLTIGVYQLQPPDAARVATSTSPIETAVKLAARRLDLPTDI